jgi:RNA polymerase sigma-70 factor (ECF subfamily)
MDRVARPATSPRLRAEESGTTDAELLLRARQGDADAFHWLFRRHAPAVRRFLGGALRDADEADEATQETFVRAHSRLSALNDAERMRAWLLGIARIVALDAHSFRRRAAQRDEENRQARVVDLDPTPEARLLDAEAERVLAEEIAGLGPQRRAALLLRVDHELAYPEIADAMGWPLQKVKNEIHRARLQIRERVLRYLRGSR